MKKVLLRVLTFTALALISCQSQAQSFPQEMDIVFQTADDAHDPLVLGFVAASGGELVFRNLPERSNPQKWPPAWPVWTPDGQQIITRRLQWRNALPAWGFMVYGTRGCIGSA